MRPLTPAQETILAERQTLTYIRELISIRYQRGIFLNEELEELTHHLNDLRTNPRYSLPPVTTH